MEIVQNLQKNASKGLLPLNLLSAVAMTMILLAFVSHGLSHYYKPCGRFPPWVDFCRSEKGVKMPNGRISSVGKEERITTVSSFLAIYTVKSPTCALPFALSGAKRVLRCLLELVLQQGEGSCLQLFDKLICFTR